MSSVRALRWRSTKRKIDMNQELPLIDDHILRAFAAIAFAISLAASFGIMLLRDDIVAWWLML